VAPGPPRPAQPLAQYYIESGVRRAVAAREVGRADIPAVIYEPGRPPLHTRLQLVQLFSPKLWVSRDARYIRNTEYPTRVLRTEPPPIEVQPLGLPGQKRSVPLAQVRLL
jgi:hypothetical protein